MSILLAGDQGADLSTDTETEIALKNDTQELLAKAQEETIQEAEVILVPQGREALEKDRTLLIQNTCNTVAAAAVTAKIATKGKDGPPDQKTVKRKK